MRITLGSNSKQYEQENFREREEREETNRVMKINTNEHDDLFPEVWFQRTYSPLRRPKGRVYSNPFPLSIGHLDWSSASS
jgi:hypothetical protein